MKKTYRQNKETGKFEEVSSRPLKRLAPVTDDLSPFLSPVDGSLIQTRKDLEKHNKRHGVTNDLDSLKEQTRRTLERQNAPISRQERARDIARTFDYIQQNPDQFRRA